MGQTYDIFEVLPDGTLEWRECVEGHEAALSRTHELAARSTNEFRVVHLPTNSILIALNAKELPKPSEGDSAAPNEGGSQTDLPVPWWSVVRSGTKSER
ncbi:MAG TPA: hypothetical protein VMF66_13575 [Candidatus Acidoferrum sp.]|nr:hypothetical protein [Candidatus Acidoferrum sp.]